MIRFPEILGHLKYSRYTFQRRKQSKYREQSWQIPSKSRRAFRRQRRWRTHSGTARMVKVSMADWKQITARIRRARTAKDPAGQLSNLFQKTRDGMVAYELARHFEAAGQSAEAVKWYSTAAERFRRADWKTKAQDAVTRLGGSLQSQTPEPGFQAAQEQAPPSTPPIPEPAPPSEQGAEILEPMKAPAAQPGLNHGPTSTRRRRRGGRHRSKAALESANAPAPGLGVPQVPALRRQPHPVTADEAGEPRIAADTETLSLPADRPEETPAVRGRYGDPGLSSRLSLLEMQFRRLLSCTPLKLDEADRAPAGPGVFLLSDSDLTSHYYVEACQTLRIAVGHLLRGSPSRRGGDSIKPRLAEHLGIAESRVVKYLREHCVVRWLQLDEDASYFAHFLIAVLHPSLNA